MQITSVEGNTQWLDGGSMFGNAPRAVWEKWVSVDECGRIPLACRSLLVEFSGVKVLCEVGIGSFFEPKLAERFGVQDSNRHILTENLTKLGVSAEEIDYVILSHLHFDHAGGLLPTWKDVEDGSEALRFPKAKYVVGQRAWERALNPHPRDRASFLPDLNKALEASTRLVIIDDDQKNIPRDLQGKVDFIYSDGHTPGQMLARWRDGRGTVVFCGDLIPGVPWMHLPITMGYDRFPEKVIDEKSDFLSEAIEQRWLLFFTHDVDNAAAIPEKDQKGKVSPSQVFSSIERQSLKGFEAV